MSPVQFAVAWIVGVVLIAAIALVVRWGRGQDRALKDTICPPEGKSVLRNTVSADAAELIEKQRKDIDRLKAELHDAERERDHKTELLAGAEAELQEFKRRTATERQLVRDVMRLIDRHRDSGRAGADTVEMAVTERAG